ncbi:MAG: hypothetical protein [Circular genetic element sp.]|nr:MAG: hypothetical protein [Circular genetic element sp.]
MPFQRVPLTTKVELLYGQQGQFVENVLHYKSLAPATEADLNALCAEFVNQWTTFLRPLTVSTAFLTSIKATSLDSEFAPGIEYTTGLPLAGTGAIPELPMNVTCAVRFLTALRGRSYRGRAYHIGLRQSFVNGSNLTSTFRTDLRNAWIGLMSIESSPVFAQCVVSRYSDGALRAEGIATDVTNVQVEGTVDSQRRRLPGRGR